MLLSVGRGQTTRALSMYLKRLENLEEWVTPRVVLGPLDDLVRGDLALELVLERDELSDPNLIPILLP